ncbi:helix-turn-helix domain-containing protein [Saccharothrix variisporea]|uniref:Helix-turn-helix protein n=1 Tax=Saccharothrix variisporea TaxID=543527 RepID=A0A495XCE4_9PSEU|nr:helix-turn-helix transcriptional regulator [Saccharothrix variisporea]RKT69208.1 hypothetical protein DFJ66_2404 [Saccharothrix variisporea]
MDTWWRPPASADSAEFVAALRELRVRTGLSYRALERRAAQVGDVLPTSTLNSALARTTVPGEQLLVAFLRACGASPEVVAEWVKARADLVVERVLPEEGEPAGDVAPDDTSDAPARRDPDTTRRRVALVAALALLVVAAGVLVALAPGRRDTPSGPHADATSTSTTAVAPAEPVGQTHASTDVTTTGQPAQRTTTTTAPAATPTPAPEPPPGGVPTTTTETRRWTTTTTTTTGLEAPEPTYECNPPPSNICFVRP